MCRCQIIMMAKGNEIIMSSHYDVLLSGSYITELCSVLFEFFN